MLYFVLWLFAIYDNSHQLCKRPDHVQQLLVTPKITVTVIFSEKKNITNSEILNNIAITVILKQ